MSRLNQTCSHSERDSLPPNCEWSGQCTVVHLSSGLLWGETAGCFVIRVLNTNVSSNRLTSPGTCYILQAWEGKKEEIWRENPWGRAWLILALGLLSNWGMGTSAEVFYKRLASLMSEKNDLNYATTMVWIRCCISYSLIRSAAMRMRWSSSSYQQPF